MFGNGQVSFVEEQDRWEREQGRYELTDRQKEELITACIDYGDKNEEERKRWTN